MAKIVKQRRKANDLSPGDERFAIGEQVDFGMTVALVRDDVEDATGQFHDTEGVFEPAMGRSGIDEVSKRELVNVPEALKWP
jgi:hypothetical protein